MTDDFHPVTHKTQVLLKKRMNHVKYVVRIVMNEYELGNMYPTWNDDWLNRIAQIDSDVQRKAEITKGVAGLKRSVDEIKAKRNDDTTLLDPKVQSIINTVEL